MTTDQPTTDSNRPQRTRRRRRAIIVTGLLLAGLVIVNALAFMHARALTHFVPAGQRTPPPEELSVLHKAKVLLTGVRFPRPENRINPADVGMPFTTHVFPGGGGALEAWHVPVAGREPAGLCVMFHSYGGNKAGMLPAAGGLRDIGYDLLLVDFRGCGGSSGNVTTIGYAEADDVAAAVEFARRTFPDRRLILYGQSMGGVAILRAVAHKGVDAEAIVIESPFDRLLTTIEHRFEAMGVPSFPSARLLVFWGGAQHGYWGFGHNPAEYAKHVRRPVLVMHGTTDARVTTAEARGVFENLAGPKQLELYEGASHLAFVANHRERWKAVVTAFLAQHTAPGPTTRAVSIRPAAPSP